MKKLKKNKSKGILFWITGLSGSGKTTIAKKVRKKIEKIYGPTILISGDDLRKIFKLNKYNYKARLEYGRQFCNLGKFITDQKVNLIFAVVGMMHSLRNWNKKNIDNYVEIYVKSNIEDIKNQKKKKIYMRKSGPIVGISIKPEFPKNPNIVINNDLKRDTQQLAAELINKLKKI